MGQGFDYNYALEQWRNFQAGKPVDERKVRAEILQSWKTCKKNHVKLDAIYQNTKPVERSVLERDAAIAMTSSEILHTYLESLPPTDIVCALYSREGAILFMEGKNRNLDSIVSREAGRLENELDIGTTCIALSLKYKKSMEIFGPEHWSPHLHDRYGCSSPILSSAGDCPGVISISRPLTEYDPSWLGVVEIMVTAISNQLKLENKVREIQELADFMSEGVVLADLKGSIVQANAIAKKILRAGAKKLPDEILAYALNEGKFKPFSKVEISFPGKNGFRAYLVSCVPSPNGGVFVFSTTQSMRRYVSEQAGFVAHYVFDNIQGSSPAFQESVKLARTASASNITTLLLGESGTGKELFAQAIHNNSNRRRSPFISVNCGAIPNSLLLSELFGYAAGAFTGASKRGRPGKFELANHGTIFLDEIGEMPLDAQAALLRVLQEKKVTRVSGDRERSLDVRVIAATNRNLEDRIASGHFRLDLFYRLRVLPIRIPPLRERTEDIIPLAEHFLRIFCAQTGKRITGFEPEVLNWLEKNPWPGNIRELENQIEALVNIVNSSRIGLTDIAKVDQLNKNPVARKNLETGLTPEIDMNTLEKDVILATLRKNYGNINRSAASLGISRNTIYNKLKNYGMSVKDFRISQK